MNKLAVISAARKLIIAVPPGPVVSFPDRTRTSKYGQNNEAPVIVVCNRTDVSQGQGGTWQGADAENGVIIANEVKEADALAALDLFAAEGGTIEALKAAVALLEARGYGDIYTTKRSFVETKLSPAGRMDGPYTGLVKRDERDIAHVWREGDLIRLQLGEESPKHIEPDILERTYRCADGSPINLAEIPSA